jgi:hypothetical protein
MNGRNAPAFAALAFVTLALAGCVAPNDFLNASDQKLEISAMEDKELADNAAKAWKTDAVLLSVFAIELSDDKTGDIPTDPSVGNGLSPAWFYAYATPGNAATRAFRVTADGRVHAENDTSIAGMGKTADAKPITDWRIDSNAALAAANANETFHKALSAPNATLAEGVAHMDGGTCWYFAAISREGGAIAMVDANTGELDSVEPFNMDFARIPKYAYKGVPASAAPLVVEGKGHVDSAKPKAEFPFTYAGEGDVANLKVNYDAMVPTDGVMWKLIGPDGEPIKADGSGSRGGAHYVLPEPGEYKLLFSYRTMAPVPTPFGGADFSFKLTTGADSHK